MINVCRSPFISEASASLIHQDDYGIQNLFSLDSKIRQKGFKIERFVRPPLTLEVCFNLPIDVYYIVLWVELHENNERCKVEFSTSTTSPTKADTCSQVQKFCGSSCVNIPLNVYHNPLRVSTHLHPINLPNTVEGSQVLEKLVCQQINLQALKPISDLTTTTSVTVCLKQYTSPKALHIKCLEVWGRPSKLCTPDHLKAFEKAKETCMTSQEHQKLSSSLAIFNSGDYPHCNTLPKTSVDQHKATDEQLNIIQREGLVQDKYLDQLTFELMVLPYQLPSGYYVDQLTVDKCKENDLLYGRKPCDPFTGVSYTETSQPRFCPRLKSEIDMYVHVSSQSDATCGSSSCGRTVGTAGQIVLHHHNLANNGRKRKWSDKMKIPENNYKKPCPDKTSTSNEKEHGEDHQGNPPSSKREIINEHETTLSNSLDEALKHLYPT